VRPVEENTTFTSENIISKYWPWNMIGKIGYPEFRAALSLLPRLVTVHSVIWHVTVDINATFKLRPHHILSTLRVRNFFWLIYSFEIMWWIETAEILHTYGY
jgi:hypothetical protein